MFFLVGEFKNGCSISVQYGVEQ